MPEPEHRPTSTTQGPRMSPALRLWMLVVLGAGSTWSAQAWPLRLWPACSPPSPIPPTPEPMARAGQRLPTGPRSVLRMARLPPRRAAGFTPAALPTPAGVLASHRHHDHAGMAALAACADHAVPTHAAIEPTREQQRWTKSTPDVPGPES